jgi:hypothetical protein
MSLRDLAKRARDNRNGNVLKAAARPFKKAESTTENFTFDYNLNYRNVEDFVRNRRFASQHVGEKWGECGVIIDSGEDHDFAAPLRPPQANWDDPVDGPVVQMQYRAEYGSYIKQKADYDSHKPKVYAYLWGKCTLAMQNVIRIDADFPLYERSKDPIRLWLRIVDISMNGTGAPENEAKRHESARYEFDKIAQKPNETVGEFYQRYLLHYDAMVGQGAQLYYVIIPNGLDATQLAAVNLEQATKEEALKAMSFIEKSDSRFKTMRDELDNAYELGRDELPTTLNAAFTMASRRRENGRLVAGQIKDRVDLHGAAFVAGKGGRPGKGPPPADGKGTECWFCHEKGHTRGPRCKLLQGAATYFQKNSVEDFIKQVKEGGSLPLLVSIRFL